MPKNFNNLENENKNIHINTKSDSSLTNYLETNIKSRNIKSNLYSSKSKSEFALLTHGKTFYYKFINILYYELFLFTFRISCCK